MGRGSGGGGRSSGGRLAANSPNAGILTRQRGESQNSFTSRVRDKAGLAQQRIINSPVTDFKDLKPGDTILSRGGNAFEVTGRRGGAPVIRPMFVRKRGFSGPSERGVSRTLTASERRGTQFFRASRNDLATVAVAQRILQPKFR